MTLSTTSTAFLREETVPGGGHLSFILRRGQVLRMTDITGGANVSMMLFNAAEKSERLNLPDTLKGQHTVRLTTGHCLYSDMGRVLAGIIDDTCGWHDPFGGVLNHAEVQEKYGQGRYQELHNHFYCNGTDNLLIEMGKWGLELEDLLMVMNFFSKVTVDEVGQFAFHCDYSQPGNYVDLYAPLDVLVILSALQHPLDPAPEYAPRPVQLTWRQATDEQIIINTLLSCPENGRALTNTQQFFQ